MKILDRVLLSVAGLSVIGILMVIATEDTAITALEAPKTLPKIQPMRQSIPNPIAEIPEIIPVGGPEMVPFGESQEILVYSKDVDLALEKYFEQLRKNPEQYEEELRLVEENSPELLLNSGKADSITVSGKNATPGQEEIPGKSSTPKIKPPSVQVDSYVVKKGDSIWRISQQYNVPVYTIVSANPESAKRPIQPGDTLKVPDRKGVFYKTKRGEKLREIAKKFKTSADRVKIANAITGAKIETGKQIFIPDAKPLPEIRYIKQKIFKWPIGGNSRLTSRYGWRTHPISGGKAFHSGIDIGANRGTSILAAASGVVAFSGDGGSYGKMIILRHKNGYFTVYGHASKLLVKVGKYVKQGQRIAKVGSTGASTGPHLHFEVKHHSNFMNPHVAFTKKEKVPVKG